MSHASQVKVVYTHQDLWRTQVAPDPEKLAVIAHCCEYAMQEMFSNIRKLKHVTVYVDMPQMQEDGSYPMGSCNNPVTADNVIPGSLDIVLNPNQSLADFTDTLLHELVHAAQIFEGRLGNSYIKCGAKPLRMWKGKAFSTRLMDYYDWPWEVEARNRASVHHVNVAHKHADVPYPSNFDVYREIEAANV